MDEIEEINYGISNFDNIGYAILTIFQMITMEGWSKIMYINMDAQGDWVCLYFLALILVGSFFLLNLILAVIMRSFTENDEREKQKLEEAKLKEIGYKRTKI